VVEIGVWNGVLKQVSRAAPDTPADFRLGERRKVVRSPHMIHAGRDGLVAVDECAVEVEDNCFKRL
jgi:hypothetical protein